MNKNVRRHNVRLFSENVDNIVINPTEIVPAEIHFPLIPNQPEIHVSMKKAAWLESLEEILGANFRDLSPIHIYTDGSLKTSTGEAGCGMVVYDNSGANRTYDLSVSQSR